MLIHDLGRASCRATTMTQTREIAVIDLGSNTARLSLYACDAGGYRHLYDYDDGARLRLIEHVDASGNLTNTALDAIAQTLTTFKGKCASAQISPSQIIAVATSALRTAPNRDSAIQRLLGATGIEVRVLSEQEEAEYAARGVSQALGMQSGLIFDLGGGGLHIARLKAGQVVATHGYLLGTLRLLRRFPNFAPTSPGELEAMRAFVAGKFGDNAWLRDGLSGGAKLVGIGGTVRALARIEQARKGTGESLRGYAISAEAIENWVRTLSAMTVDDLLALPGLKSARIDMVLFGAIIVRELMSAAGAKALHVCDTSIRDGIAGEFVARLAAEG